MSTDSAETEPVQAMAQTSAITSSSEAYVAQEKDLGSRKMLDCRPTLVIGEDGLVTVLREDMGKPVKFTHLDSPEEARRAMSQLADTDFVE